MERRASARHFPAFLAWRYRYRYSFRRGVLGRTRGFVLRRDAVRFAISPASRCVKWAGYGGVRLRHRSNAMLFWASNRFAGISAGILRGHSHYLGLKLHCTVTRFLNNIATGRDP